MDHVEPKLFEASVLIADLIFNLALDDADALGDPRLKRCALGSRRPM